MNFNKAKYLIALISLLLIQNLNAKADNHNVLENYSWNQAISLIYNFDFDHAEDYLKDYPQDSLIYQLTKSYSLYWQFLSTNNQSYADSCECLLVNLPSDKNSIYNKQYYLLGEFLKLRLYIAQDKYIKLFFSLNSIKTLLNQTSKKENKDINSLYWAVYNTYLSYALNQRPMFKYFFYNWPKAEYSAGLNKLKELTTSESTFIKTESLYFLMKFYFEVSCEYENGIKCAELLVRNFDNNLLYKYYLIKNLKSINNYDLVEAKLKCLNQITSSEFYSIEQKIYFKRLISDI